MMRLPTASCEQQEPSEALGPRAERSTPTMLRYDNTDGEDIKITRECTDACIQHNIPYHTWGTGPWAGRSRNTWPCSPRRSPCACTTCRRFSRTCGNNPWVYTRHSSSCCTRCSGTRSCSSCNRPRCTGRTGSSPPGRSHATAPCSWYRRSPAPAVEIGSHCRTCY